MSNQDKSWQQALDALLAGNLSDSDAKTLRKELDADARRAKDIIDAYQIQNGLESIGIEQAPATLRKKLRAIPIQQNDTEPSLLRWGAFATIAVSLTVALLIISRPVSDGPTQAEIEQARKELIIAFNYLQEAGQTTNRHIKQEIGGAMQEALIKGIFSGVRKQPENS